MSATEFNPLTHECDLRRPRPYMWPMIYSNTDLMSDDGIEEYLKMFKAEVYEDEDAFVKNHQAILDVTTNKHRSQKIKILVAERSFELISRNLTSVFIKEKYQKMLSISRNKLIEFERDNVAGALICRKYMSVFGEDEMYDDIKRKVENYPLVEGFICDSYENYKYADNKIVLKGVNSEVIHSTDSESNGGEDEHFTSEATIENNDYTSPIQYIAKFFGM